MEDVCLAKEGKASNKEIDKIRCQNIEDYVDTVLEKGVIIGTWRKKGLCRK